MHSYVWIRGAQASRHITVAAAATTAAAGAVVAAARAGGALAFSLAHQA